MIKRQERQADVEDAIYGVRSLRSARSFRPTPFERSRALIVSLASSVPFVSTDGEWKMTDHILGVATQF